MKKHLQQFLFDWAAETSYTFDQQKEFDDLQWSRTFKTDIFIDDD